MFEFRFVFGLLFVFWFAGCGVSDSESLHAPQKSVQFALHAPGLPDSVSVHVAGNADALGRWAPDGLRLERVGENDWQGIASVDVESLEFKWTLGSWEREALNRRGFGRENSVLILTGDTLIRDTVLQWSEGTAPREIRGGVTGEVVEWPVQVEIPELLPRSVWEWVPVGSQPIQTVLMLHDGRNLFDPHRANFGVDWGVDEMLDSLQRDGNVGRVLAVGFDCTDERSADYGYTEAGLAYVEWLASKGKALIRARHELAKDCRFIVGGASMGGLISLIALQEHPDAFDGAICMSPAFGYRGFNYAEVLNETGIRFSELPVWIDNGSIGLEEELQPGVDDMTKVVQQNGACFEVRVFPGARHFEADWGERLDEALMWVLQKNCEHPN